MPAPTVDVALETSRREASLALLVDGVRFADELGERAHASDLLARLAELLARAGVTRREGRLPLRAVFAGLGPGSYTGLRVGLATAQALARASDAALFGLSSFDALAFRELVPGEEGAVVQDARAGRFYHARYRRSERGLEVCEAPAALTAEELCVRCARPGVILGHAGLADAAGLAPEVRARLRTDARPSAAALLELARARVESGELAPSHALEPLYLAAFGTGRDVPPGPAAR